MKQVLGVLLGLALGFGANRAHADSPTIAQLANPGFSLGKWNAVCDGQGGCSTWGMGTSWATPGYIILATGADGRRTITLGAYDTNDERRWHEPLLFSIEIVDKLDRVIWSKAFPGRDESRIWLRARITDPGEVDRALKALAVGKEARLKVDGQTEPATVVSLDGSAAALLWSRSHDGIDPTRLVIHRAARVSQGRLPKTPPPARHGNYDEGCPATKEMSTVARLAPGKVLWISTCRDGYNNDSALRLTDDQGRPLRKPAIDGPSDADTNVTYDPSTRVLTSTFYANSSWTCGDAYQWVWDGERFGFSSRSRMEDCEGMNRNDWPVLYRARIVDP